MAAPVSTAFTPLSLEAFETSDAFYPRVGMPAVEDFTVQHSGHFQVLNVRGASGHLRRGIPFRNPFSNGGQVHGHLPFAADRIASRILTYPVHLHRLPSMPSLISSSRGSPSPAIRRKQT